VKPIRHEDAMNQTNKNTRTLLAIAAIPVALAAVSAWWADIRMLAAVTGLSLAVWLIWLGPHFTFPLYFATWFGTGLFIPGLPVSLNRTMAALFILSWGIWLLKGGRPRLRPWLLWTALGFLTLWAVAIGLLGRVPVASPSVQQLAYLAPAFALATPIHTRDQLQRLAAVMVAIGCVINTAGLAEFILRRDLFSQFSDHRMVSWDLRINGIAPNAIVFAFTCVWLIPWALWLHIESRSPFARWLALAAFAYLATLSLLTFNRQTPLILAAMLGVGLLLVRYPWRGTLIAVCAALFVIVAPLVIGRIVERVSQLGGDGPPDISLMIRRDKVLVAREIIDAHPWTGIGLNNFKDHWWEHRPHGQLYQIHTDMARPQYIDLGWLQILTETGIIGLALLLVTLATAAMTWLHAWRRARDHRALRNGLVAVLMLFIQLAVSMMVQDTFFTPWTYLAFALLVAMTSLPAKQPEP